MFHLGLNTAPPKRVGPGFSLTRSNNEILAFPGGTEEYSSLEGGITFGKPSSDDRFAHVTRAGSSKAEVELPAKLALVGQKLTFKGFFEESVPESPLEMVRKRILIIRYFLDDDSIEIYEDARRNDGLPHGRFLKRMKVPSVTLESFQIGQNINVFGRIIRITSCDAYTREFFASMGIELSHDEDITPDQWQSTQAIAPANEFHGVKSSAITRFIEAVNGSSRTASFKKDIKGRFLKYDNQALRFLVVWEDKKGGNGDGEKQKFWLTYFLATEEVEIIVAKGQKSVVGWSTLLKKSRLPRFVLAHDDRMRSAEDVCGDEDYYNEDDFIVGKPLHVFGREMLIADCDRATHAWYMQNKGIDQRSNRVDVSEPVPEPVEIPIPPHIGIGSEEDTLASWKNLIPRSAPPDFAKLRNATGETRKFIARLDTKDDINADRRFRFTVFIDDNHISVYEMPIRNSGIVGGPFMKKSRVKKNATEYYTLNDFKVGEKVVVKSHHFLLIEEERQPVKEVPDVVQIIATLKLKLLDGSASLRKMFRKFDLDKSQSMSFQEFCNMLNYYSLGLSKYEAIVLFKAFEDTPGFMSYSNFMTSFSASEDEVRSSSGSGRDVATDAADIKSKYTHEQLDAFIVEALEAAKRATEEQEQQIFLARIARNFRNTKTANDLHNCFRRFDFNKDHLIDENEFRQVMGHAGLYLSDSDIDMLVKRFFRGAEYINYESFMEFLSS